VLTWRLLLLCVLDVPVLQLKDVTDQISQLSEAITAASAAVGEWCRASIHMGWGLLSSPD
jgi:hypothetical protein